MYDKKTSTISTEDIIPIATKAVQRFIKGKNPDRILRYFGSHMTLEDLVMETVVKILQAEPTYLTRSYVNTAAKCVCIDRMQQRKIPWVDTDTLVTYEDGETVPIEELLEGDTYDHMGDLEEYIETFFSPEEYKLYKGLISRKLYAELAKEFDISVRTLERKIHDLKWKINLILKL